MTARGGAGSGAAVTAAAGNGKEEAETTEALAQAVSFVLRSTRARPQTEAEVAGKLRGRGVADDVAAQALAKARAAGMVDDAAFARAWVEDRGRQRGYAVPRLREELRRRQVPESVIGKALAALDDRDDLAAATALARRRAQHLPTTLTPEAVARRVLGFLARRGYPQALARRATIEAVGLDRDWD